MVESFDPKQLKTALAALPSGVRLRLTDDMIRSSSYHDPDVSKLFEAERARGLAENGALSDLGDGMTDYCIKTNCTNYGPPFTTDSEMQGLIQEYETLRLGVDAQKRAIEELKAKSAEDWKAAQAAKPAIYALYRNAGEKDLNAALGIIAETYKKGMREQDVAVSDTAIAAVQEYKSHCAALEERIEQRSRAILSEAMFGPIDTGMRRNVQDYMYMSQAMTMLPDDIADKRALAGPRGDDLRRGALDYTARFECDKDGNLRQRTVTLKPQVSSDMLPRKIEDTFVAGVRRRRDIEYKNERKTEYYDADGRRLAEKPGFFARAAIAFNVSAANANAAPAATYSAEKVTAADRLRRIDAVLVALPGELRRDVVLRLNSAYPDCAVPSALRQIEQNALDRAACNDAARKLCDAVSGVAQTLQRLESLNETFGGRATAAAFSEMVDDINAVQKQYADISLRAAAQDKSNADMDVAIEGALEKIDAHLKNGGATPPPAAELTAILVKVTQDIEGLPDGAAQRTEAYKSAAAQMQGAVDRTVRSLDERMQQISDAARAISNFLNQSGMVENSPLTSIGDAAPVKKPASKFSR